MRSPVGLCGSLFETACDGAHAYVASECSTPLSSSVVRFVSERGVMLTPYPGCKQYTEGAYASVFASSMDLDCAY
jgi:hypothetical protein